MLEFAVAVIVASNTTLIVLEFPSAIAIVALAPSADVTVYVPAYFSVKVTVFVVPDEPVVPLTE